MISCKQASKYASQNEYTELTLLKKLSLHFHMLLCKSCRLVAKQLQLMKSVVKDSDFEEEFLHNKKDGMSEESKAKLKKALENQP